jgi:beta-xylosidase
VANASTPVRASDNLLGDEYLQVGVDGGLIGLLLLGALGASVILAVRGRTAADPARAAGRGALVAFAVGGLVDFSWHLPAIALAGGVVAGLAALPPGRRVHLVAARTRREAIGSSGLRRWPWVVGVIAIAACVALVASETPRSASAADPALTLAAPTRDHSTSATHTGPTSDAGIEVPAGGPGVFVARGPDLTDPFILHVGDRYYLYTSEGGTSMNVPVRVGTSLTSWGPAREVLPRLPAWADPAATWAPDVRKVQGGWALYFSALVHGIQPAEHCVGAAFGPSPTGPFVADPKPFVCQLDRRGTIDPRTFLDKDGQLVLDFKSEDNANPGWPGPDQNGRTVIWAQRLSPDGRRLLGPATPILQPTQPWEGTIVEAPDMVYVDGNYWLFYSGGWFNTSGYGVGYAICKSAFGPCSDLSPSPLLGSNAQGSGPGESSVFLDDGHAYLLYNPWHANDPAATPPRPVAVAPLRFGADGPHLVRH